MNQYFNNKLSLFLTEVGFDTSEVKELSYFQNVYTSKFLKSFYETHNQVKYR